MYEVIVAPTDGSDLERPALTLAVQLAKRFGSAVHLIRVETPPVAVEPSEQRPVLSITPETLEEEREGRVRKLETLGTELQSSSPGVRIVPVLKAGQVAPVLRDYVEQVQPDLVVMSSHSRGGLQRVALGSVTDFVIRQTNVPVMVVKPGSKAAQAAENSFRTILVPLDGSVHAEQVLREIVPFARKLSSMVAVLHVLTPITYAQHEIMQPGLPWWDTEVAVADSYLARAEGYLHARGVEATKHVLLGDDVSAAILDCAKASKSDLIALATTGKGGFKRFLFGTVADTITRSFTGCVLVYHPDPEAGQSILTESAGSNVFAVSRNNSDRE